MDRREFLKKGIRGAAAAAAIRKIASSSSVQAATGSDPARPNILYLIVHDLGRSLSCYGHPTVKTPHLDELASEGVRFDYYFCSSAACSPSRGCIMTGRYAHTNGLIGLANRGWSLPDSERTTVDYLNDAGYLTVNIGGQHERKPRESYRYKKLGPQRRQSDLVADDVCEFLKTHDPKDGPFYLNVYSQDVHAPWNRPEFQGRYSSDSIRPPAFVPNTSLFRKALSQFYGSISFMDEGIGKILAGLRQSGLEKNTLVIFTTDHGISFPRAKGTLYDPGLGTALIMRWPGRLKPGAVCDHLLANIDLLPTQLELAGLEIPRQVQGRSFAQALLGGDYTPNEQIFVERNFHDDYDPKRAVRTRTHKLIRNYSEHPRFKLPSEATEEDTGATMRDAGKPRPFEELYDLTKDPNEFSSVADDPAYATVLQDLRGRLDKWMSETADYMRGAREFVHSPERDTQFVSPTPRAAERQGVK